MIWGSYADLIGNELANYTHAAELGWSGNTDYCFWTGLSCNTRGELVQM